MKNNDREGEIDCGTIIFPVFNVAHWEPDKENDMELFRQAVTIMVLGMGLVFVFLALVILLVQATAAVIRRYEEKAGSSGQVTTAGGDGDRVAAVIAVALHEQR